jgi:hypothetical protein
LEKNLCQKTGGNLKKMNFFCEYNENCLPLQGNKEEKNMLRIRKTGNSGYLAKSGQF